jgi:uncharacterized protein (DUF169 family)
MGKWFELGNKLSELLNPATFPVAVKILERESKIPTKARRPLRNMKVRIID